MRAIRQKHMINRDRDLAIALQSFLTKPYETVRRSATYRVIRNYVESRGNWKKAPSGNPRKGYQAMQEVLTRRAAGQ